jgi:hypothetical protein
MTCLLTTFRIPSFTDPLVTGILKIFFARPPYCYGLSEYYLKYRCLVFEHLLQWSFQILYYVVLASFRHLVITDLKELNLQPCEGFECSYQICKNRTNSSEAEMRISKR